MIDLLISLVGIISLTLVIGSFVDFWFLPDDELCPNCSHPLPESYDEDDAFCGYVYECFECDWSN